MNDFLSLLKVQRGKGVLALATILLLTIAFRLHSARLADIPPADIPLETLPMKIGDWTGVDTAGLDVRSLDILRLSRYVKRYYRNSEGKGVILYIGYWDKQTGDYQAAKHSPELCLPSNGWAIERKYPRTLSMRGALSTNDVDVKRIVGQIADETHVFYYWFFTGDKNYAEEWQALFRISLQTFFAGRSDGGIIEVSAKLESGASRKETEEKTEEIIESFLKDLYPVLNEMITKPPSA